MIDKQTFVDAINSMMLIDDYQKAKNKLYQKFNADGYLLEPDNNDIILRLLKLLAGSDRYDDTIETFCLVNNYGRGKGNTTYVDKDGVIIAITSPEELYDYIFEYQGGEELSVNTE